MKVSKGATDTRKPGHASFLQKKPKGYIEKYPFGFLPYCKL